RAASTPPAQHCPRRNSLHAEAFPKNLDSDDHFDCPFLFMAVKGKNYETKKTEISSTTIRTKNYDCSTHRKINLPLPFSTCSPSHRTGARYRACAGGARRRPCGDAGDRLE